MQEFLPSCVPLPLSSRDPSPLPDVLAPLNGHQLHIRSWGALQMFSFAYTPNPQPAKPLGWSSSKRRPILGVCAQLTV
ncbi:hypothetical protein NDU88_004033 [Pleurodeles waltl]|uniref:Uncharacterized protein n=1 Tax=Pleurodeles waltl TaxID=8319 RepID=A0AAV7TRA6_PLEWA|nr:hypothetical protein NDU88_004033 [Pleurodeles waltl]